MSGWSDPQKGGRAVGAALYPTLSSLLASTPQPGMRATASDAPGSMLFDVGGKWGGSLGYVSQATLDALTADALAMLVDGVTVTISGTLYIHAGGAWDRYRRWSPRIQSVAGNSQLLTSQLKTIDVPTIAGPGSTPTQSKNWAPESNDVYHYNTAPTYELSNGVMMAVQKDTTRGSVATPNKGTLYSIIEFATDAPVFETFGLASTSIYWRLSVYNESLGVWEYVQDWAAYPSYNNFYMRFTFSARKPRKIRWETSGGTTFAGVRTDALSTVWKPAPARACRVFLSGDSWLTSGIHFGGKLLENLGVSEGMINGIGGTGYLNNASTKTTFLQRIQDVANFSPDMIVSFGGLNDIGYADADITSAVLAYHAGLRSVAPNAVIIPVTTQAPSVNRARNLQVSALVKAAYLSIGITPIDASLLMTGTGKTSDLKGDGNCDMYTDDGIHPNTLGVPYLADVVSRAILTWLQSNG